jgi:hypothetical protein
VQAGQARQLAFAELHALQRNPQHTAAIAHRVIGVGAKIHHDAVHLRGVGDDRARIGVNVTLNVNRRGQRSAQQRQRFLDDQVKLQHIAFAARLPAESQNLLDKFLRAQRALHDVLNVAAHGAGRRHVADREFGVADDRRQNVIKVVRDSPGKRAHGLHALAVLKLCFQALAISLHVLEFSDVNRGAGDAAEAACFVPLGHIVDSPDPSADFGAVDAGSALKSFANADQSLRLILVNFPGRDAHDFLRLQVQRAESASLGECENSFPVHGPKDNRCGVNHGLEMLLQFTDFALGFVQFRHVHADSP